jgi:hypothetical protein
MTSRILCRAALIALSPVLAPWLLAACGGAAFSIESADGGEPDASVDAGKPDAAPDANPGDGGVCPPGEHQCLDCYGIPSCGSVCPNIACPVDAGVRDAAPPDIDASKDVCFPDGGTAPSLKACTSPSECTYVRHTTDCCGSVELVGVASARTTAFAVCEKAWEAQLPTCGCLVAGGVKTEDGQTDVDGAAPKVACVPTSSGSQCMTSL